MIRLDDFILEKIESKDLPLHYRLVSDVRVMKMITGKGMNMAEAEEKFARILSANLLHPVLGYFKITNHRTGQFIGVAKIELKEQNAEAAELGYLLLPEFWGAGIAGKIAKKLIELAREENKLYKLYAIIDPQNLPSRKILVKNGFLSKEVKVFDGLQGELFELNIN